MINFNNTAIAFAHKSNKDLKRAYWLFKIIGWNWLIKIGPGLLKVLLPLQFPIPIIRATIFKQFCGGESISDCNKTIESLGKYHVKTILDYSVEGKKNEAEFDKNVEETLRTIERGKNDPNIPFAVFKPSGFARFDLLEKIQLKKAISPEEENEYKRVVNRFDSMCKKAFEANHPIMIDAEETWVQDVIDDIVLDLMRKYNKDRAIVYNTAQMYRHDRNEYLKNLYEIAKKEGFKVGMKLVRGAYMEKERERAEKMGYPSPINPTKEATDKCYDDALTFCMTNHDVFATVSGSHNEISNNLFCELIEQLKLDKNDSRFYSAQLLGMSDHISYNLAKLGYNVAKYVPYGPVKDVVPYLIRRAEENTSVAGQRGRELSLIETELKRRKAN